MSRAAKPRCSLPPVTAPAHCWNWTTAEDVVRHALAAFYIACTNARKAGDGRAWLHEGKPYASRETWLDALVYAFEMRVSADAHAIGAVEYPEAAERLSKLTADKLTAGDSPRSISGPCAG
jgi:hypothetical protein